MGDPMPENQEILPSRQALEAEWMGDDAMLQSFEDVYTPPPPVRV